MAASEEKSLTMSLGICFLDKINMGILISSGPKGHLEVLFIFPNLGSGAKGVKPFLVKGLELNPHAVPIEALYYIIHQDITLGII